MNDQLICCVDMFSTTQVLVTPEGERIMVEGIDNLAQFAVDYCITNKVPTVHFFGEDKYVSGLLDRKPELMFAFNNNNIKVEVN